MITLALSTLISTSTAATPQAWVVLSRRTGVSAPKALTTATDVSAALKGVPLPIALEDLTTCKAKKVCLLDAARKKSAAVLVTVEVGAVLEDGTLRVEALSVDEDGKSLGVVDADGPVAGLVAKATPKLSGDFSTTLRNALGLVPPPEPKPVPPAPLVDAKPVEPKPDPKPVEVAAVPVEVGKTAEPSFLTGGRLAGLIVGGAGAVALIVGGIFGLQASSGAAKVKMLCPDGAQCTNPEAFSVYKQAADAQNLGVALSVGGTAALAAGAVVFLLNPGGSSATAMIVPVPGGVMASAFVGF